MFAAEFSKAFENMKNNCDTPFDLPQFHGLPSEDVFDFIDAIEIYKLSANINDETVARKVPRLLKGLAANWFAVNISIDKTIAANWQTLKSKLIDSFCPDKNAYKLFLEEKLRSRRQGDSEPFRNYYFEILKLCTRIDAEMPESTKITRLLSGLKPDTYRQLAASLPTTCAALLEKVQQIENVESVIKLRSETLRNEINPYIKPFVEAAAAFQNNANKEQQSLICTAYVNNFKVKAVIDTGSGCSLINSSLFSKLNEPLQLHEKSTFLKLADGKIIAARGSVKANLKFGPLTFQKDFLLLENFSHDLLIGNDILTNSNISINLSPNNQYIEFKDANAKLNIQSASPDNLKCVINDNYLFAPHSVNKVKIICRTSVIKEANQKYIFETLHHLFNEKGLRAVPGYVNNANSEFEVFVANHSDATIAINKGTKIGKLEKVSDIDDSEIISSSFISENDVNKFVKKRSPLVYEIMNECDYSQIVTVNIDKLKSFVTREIISTQNEKLLNDENVEHITRKSKRCKKVPEYLKDYVLNNEIDILVV
ncbi:hypothetical protein B4U80_14863 [Leptotrombidium deliense]|uniref:Retrotransposon gag domain-containing protein n=1 Tax=Leptotrombidium deliense TaxID=299467 RepID=A0A443SEZ6_9ACAR|nr:hypothetical protein B4U80_14863 [Leptotrombidium deliense]